MRVWEAGSGRLLHTLTGHTDGVAAVGWSPDGSRLVSGGNDRTIRIWHPTPTQHDTTADHPTDRVLAVGWSPDGSRLVSGGGDGTVRVWEAGSGRLQYTLPRRGIGTLTRRLLNMSSGHTGGVAAVGWSPDGSRLVSGGDDGRLVLWSPPALTLKLSLQLDELAAVSWTSAGIAVGGVNGVAVFDLR